jgi:hypothetical protein
MYKHAWSKSATPPRFVVKESPLEQQQRQLNNYLKDFALAELKNRRPPKMPWYQWKKYKSAIERAGGLREWACHRPEWEKAKSAANRTLKRGKKRHELSPSVPTKMRRRPRRNLGSKGE